MKKYICKWVYVLIIMSLLVGCREDGTGSSPKEDTEQLKIGVLIYRFDDQFMQSMKKEMLKDITRLKEENTGTIIYEFADSKNQQEIQDDQINRFIEDGCDVLAINLVDRRVAAQVIEVAKKADIPIVFFNREPVQEDMARWDKLYYVGTEAEEAGIIQGEIVRDYILSHPEVDSNKDGMIQYVMLQGQPGHQDAILRSQNSVNTIKESGILLEELARDTANWQKKEAKDKMSNWLESFSEEIELILSNNDAMALGAIEAMKKRGKQLPIVGVDAIELAVEAVEKGEMIGTVMNDNVVQGQGIVRIAYYLAKGLDPKDYIQEIQVGKYLWIPYKRVNASN